MKEIYEINYFIKKLYSKGALVFAQQNATEKQIMDLMEKEDLAEYIEYKKEREKVQASIDRGEEKIWSPVPK